MPAKEILFSDRARRQMGDGLNALADAVKVTLGPRGRNVMIGRSWGSPTITKDGVTVAKEIELENRFANMGAQMVKEVASNTADMAGDGTTTATVLAQAIFAAGSKLVSAGFDPMDIKRGIDTAVRAVVVELASQSKPTRGRSEIAQVGVISSNGDETIGNLIADAMEKVGREGVVTVEEAQSIETTLEFVEGMQFDRGYISSYFVTNAERMEAVLDDAHLLILDQRVSQMNDLLPLLEEVAETQRPLLVVAEDISGEALATLVVNNLRGTLRVCAVKAPGFGEQRREMLDDIAVLAGGQTVTADVGINLESLTLEHLGHAKTIVVDKDTTTLIGGGGDRDGIEARKKQLRAQIEDSASDYDREKLRKRLAKIMGGVAVIKVGAATETEMEEKKARVDDALSATRAAIAEGIVPGGGVALLRTLPALDKLELTGDQQAGVNIVRRALEEPLRQIAQNSGADGAVVVSRVLTESGAYGYNAASGVYEDLVAAGVIDPTKVVRAALQNAASVASLMLTTEAAMAEQPFGPSI